MVTGLNLKSICLRTFCCVLFLFSLALAGSPPRPAAHAAPDASILRVAVGGATSGSCGGDWSSPCDLRYALQSRALPGDQVWVKAGVYRPGPSGARTAAFALPAGVAVYGGFAGAETALEQRDWSANLTILSGDIDANDANLDGNDVAESSDDIQGGNAYHVVTSSSVTETARLDGFTVTAGLADGASFPADSGGGMYNLSAGPSLSNLVFSGNRAGVGGGGVYNDSSAPVLSGVLFTGNRAGGGGGMSNESASNPVLTGVTFLRNRSDYGGALYNWGSSPSLDRVAFTGNTASVDGGGMSCYMCSARLSNVLFSGNHAAYGGAISVYYSSSLPRLSNVTLSGNRANTGGGMYNDYNSAPQIDNTILWGNTASSGAQVYNNGSGVIPVFRNSLVQGGVAGLGQDGGGNLAADPLFARSPSPGADAAWGTADDDYGDLRLRPPSPAVDAGSNALVLAGVTTDLAGDLRLVNYLVDIGAYERQPATLYVDLHAPGPQIDGLSWTTAFTAVQPALAAAVYGDQLWVADGVYTPGPAGMPGAAFALLRGVALYGGFAGTESALPQRDWNANLTVLSGDLAGDDLNADLNFVAETWSDIQGENAYHVVSGNGVTATAVLDGFTITGGSATTGSCPGAGCGGGMYNTSASPTLRHLAFRGNQATWAGGMYDWYSSPALEGVAFRGNRAEYYGGGMDNANSSPGLVDVTFEGNQATYGGGMSNEGGGVPALTGVTFHANQAGYGGGMYNYETTPHLVNVVFYGNRSDYYGGGMRNISSSPSLSNVVFSGNQAGDGGGLANDLSSSPALSNVTFSGNQAAAAGGGMYNDRASKPQVDNTLLWGNTAATDPQVSNLASQPVFRNSLVQGGVAGLGQDGGGNLAYDPLLVRLPSPGADAAWGTSDDDYGDLHPRPASPAVEAGDTAFVLPGVTVDLAGNPRLAGAVVDIGAYEVQSPNHAPALDTSGSPALDPLLQGVPPGSGLAVADLIQRLGGSRITDGDDPGALCGLAFTAAGNTHGAWQYTTDGGASWQGFGSPSETAALLLSDALANRVRFVPLSGFSGTVDPGLAFRAWDQADARPDGSRGVDVTFNGSSAAFSAQLETASIQVAESQLVYQLTDPPGSEWCLPRADVTPGGSKFLGQFGNETACISLDSLPQHHWVTLSFDLYVIRTWNGNTGLASAPAARLPAAAEEAAGPDRFQVAAQDVRLLDVTFATWPGELQSYPYSFGQGNFPANTGAAQVNTLGYTFEGQPCDAVYHITRVFRHAAADLRIDFTALGLQEISNESWGLADVRVLVSDQNILQPWTMYLPAVRR